MSAPVRTCVGCGRRAPKAELLRFVAPEGRLVPDPAGRAPGRGAYSCSRRSCVERAAARRAFSRALRRSIEVPADLQGVYEEG